VWAKYLDGHLPTTTTVEVSRLATHRRCKIEISAVAVRGEPRRAAGRAKDKRKLQPTSRSKRSAARARKRPR
jgi:hypothetical protein